jgi:hypothetical protein
MDRDYDLLGNVKTAGTHVTFAHLLGTVDDKD